VIVRRRRPWWRRPYYRRYHYWYPPYVTKAELKMVRDTKETALKALTEMKEKTSDEKQKE